MSIQLAYFPFDDVGAISDTAKIDVDSTGAISHTINVGKKGIIFQNIGNKQCWFGGPTVEPSTKRGNILLPRSSIMFRNVRATFKVYFKCGSGDTTEIGVIEYD